MRSDLIEKLFKEYYNDALLYTLSLCKDKAVAEDIVSESFFKALSSRDDGIHNFKAWLLTVCRNEFYMLCRKRKYFTEQAMDPNQSDGADKVAEEIIRNDDYKLLYRSIGSLAPAQKEAVTLFYFSGLSVKDISAIMEKSENHVKVLLHRARENLKKELEGKL